MNFVERTPYVYVVLSCGLRETSMMVDYTERERRKSERKKFVNVCFTITSSPPPAHHRERINIFFFLIIIIIIIIIIFRRGFFTNFHIKQNYTERIKTERKKEFKLTLDHRAHHREKKFFFFFLEK